MNYLIFLLLMGESRIITFSNVMLNVYREVLKTIVFKKWERKKDLNESFLYSLDMIKH